MMKKFWKILAWLRQLGFLIIVLSTIGIGGSLVVAPKWTVNMFLSIDQLGNTFFGGDPDETISSRLGKWSTNDVNWEREATAGIVCWFLNLIDDDHCVTSIDETEGDDAVTE